jgi:hypothetical protein
MLTINEFESKFTFSKTNNRLTQNSKISSTHLLLNNQLMDY